MLRYSLVIDQVSHPGLPFEWPAPLDLKLGLNEVLLLEGIEWEEGLAFWQLAATLEVPQDGEVLLWGQNWFHLPRTELFRLRKQIAYIAPGQVLLQHLNLRENIALPLCYYQDVTVSQALKGHRELLDQLGLRLFLHRMPAQLSPDVYWRGLWARELLKGPELILACLDGPGWTRENQVILQEVLEAYIARNQSAVLLGGQNLASFYPVAHRLLRPADGSFSETPLLQRRDQSPVTFFPLI
jgi:ABC-type ATPase involved in cell division